MGEDDTVDNVRRPGARGNKHPCEIPAGRQERNTVGMVLSKAEQTRVLCCAKLGQPVCYFKRFA